MELLLLIKIRILVGLCFVLLVCYERLKELKESLEVEMCVLVNEIIIGNDVWFDYRWNSVFGYVFKNWKESWKYKGEFEWSIFWWSLRLVF